MLCVWCGRGGGGVLTTCIDTTHSYHTAIAFACAPTSQSCNVDSFATRTHPQHRNGLRMYPLTPFSPLPHPPLRPLAPFPPPQVT
jgi:hypothetical protein